VSTIPTILSSMVERGALGWRRLCWSFKY